jgi:chaperone required for assembly of F1-ATPase
MPVLQSADTIMSMRAALAGMTPFTLAGLGILVPAMGSLVLGMAVAEGALGAEEASSLAFLDELFQAEFWGDDAQAAERRRLVAADILDAARFIQLSQAGLAL